jgi:type IV pilus assembly protein PilB
VQSALTGHLVLSTVHTNDAAGAITRLIEMGIEPFLVSSVLLISFAQRLVRKVCGDCREPYSPSNAELEFWGIDPEAAELVTGRGCFQCKDSGYRGRTGIFETLVVDEEVQDMIMARRSAQEITRAMYAAGRLRTLKENALEKVKEGITSMQEATSAVM